MNLFTWLDGKICELLMLTLAHFLWQGLALGIFAGLIGWLLRRRSAQSRYLLFLFTLLLMVACPPATYCWLQSETPQSDEITLAELPPLTEIPAGAGREPLWLPLEADVNPADLHAALPLPAEEQRQQSQATLFQWLTLCYFTGVLLLLGRFGLGIREAAHLRRASHAPVDREILAALARRAETLRMRVVPPVLLSERLLIPAVAGVLRPAILLPVSMLSGLTPAQLENVLTHELAHIRRYDHLVNVLQRVIEAFLFFHPAVWYVSRRLRTEREHCCDDLVVALGTAPVDYAATLLSVIESGLGEGIGRKYRQLAMLSAVGGSRELRRRIERLVKRGHQPQVFFTRKGILMTALTTMVLAAGSLLAAAAYQATDETDSKKTETTAGQSEEVTTVGGDEEVTLPELASRLGSQSEGSDSEAPAPAEKPETANTGDDRGTDTEEMTPGLREQPEAKDIKLVAVVHPENYLREAWLFRQSDQKRFVVREGDTLEAGTARIEIREISPAGITLRSGGNRLRLETGKLLSDAVIEPSAEEADKQSHFLNLSDPGAMLGILREISPDSEVQISHVQGAGLIIRGKQERVKDIQRIANLLERLDRDLKSAREAEAIIKLLSAKTGDVQPRIAKVFRLQQLDPTALAETLKALYRDQIASKRIAVGVDARNNSLVVTAGRSEMIEIERVVELLQKPPASPGRGNAKLAPPEDADTANRKKATVVFPIRFTEAVTLLSLLREIFPDQIQSGEPRVTADPRTNSLIAIGTPEELKLIEEMIEVLDVPVEPRKEQRSQPDSTPAKDTQNWPVTRGKGAGMPADLIQLIEKFSDARRDMQLAETQYARLSGLADRKAVSALELDKAKVNYEAARQKLDLLKQVVEAEIQAAENEIADLSRQIEMSEQGATSLSRAALKRKLLNQQLRLKILKDLLDR